MPKYHIGKGGIPRICKATVRPCPYGGDEAHFTTIDAAQRAADNLNTQLQQLNQNHQIGFATVNNNAYVYNSDGVDLASRLLVKSKRNKERLESAFDYYKNQLLRTMQNANIKSIKDELGTISFIAAGERTTVDVDSLKEQGLYDQYSKLSHYSEFITTEDDIEDSKLAKVAKDYETSLKDYSSDDISFSVTEDGQLSPEGREALRKLRDLKLKIDRFKETEKEVKSRLIESMKSQNLKEYTANGIKFIYVPEGDRSIVDTQALKDAELYNTYSRVIPTEAQVRFRFTA